MKQKLKQKLSQYFIYHIRWQISAVVMFPIMSFLTAQGYPLWATLSIGQFFGALIFFKIDKLIFEIKKKENK